MVGQAGLEPATPRLSSACSNQLSYRPVIVTGRQWPVGGGKETRTPDILLAKQALYQLSYTPNIEIWAILDLNQGPHPYQGCALTN